MARKRYNTSLHGEPGEKDITLKVQVNHGIDTLNYLGKTNWVDVHELDKYCSVTQYGDTQDKAVYEFSLLANGKHIILTLYADGYLTLHDVNAKRNLYEGRASDTPEPAIQEKKQLC